MTFTEKMRSQLLLHIRSHSCDRIFLHPGEKRVELFTVEFLLNDAALMNVFVCQRVVIFYFNSGFAEHPPDMVSLSLEMEDLLFHCSSGSSLVCCPSTPRDAGSHLHSLSQRPAVVQPVTDGQHCRFLWDDVREPLPNRWGQLFVPREFELYHHLHQAQRAILVEPASPWMTHPQGGSRRSAASSQRLPASLPSVPTCGPLPCLFTTFGESQGHLSAQLELGFGCILGDVDDCGYVAENSGGCGQ